MNLLLTSEEKLRTVGIHAWTNLMSFDVWCCFLVAVRVNIHLKRLISRTLHLPASPLSCSLPPPTRLHQYADPVTDLLDQCGVFRTRLFRESCVFHQGCYVKDLSRLGRDLHKTLILDNSPASYIFHPNNAVSFDLLLIFVIKNIDTNIQKKAWVLGGKWQKVNLFFIKAWILFSPKIWKGFSPDLYPDEEEVWWCEISSNKIINQTKFK